MKQGDGRSAQLVRVLKLARELEKTRVWNLRKLAVMFEVHPRTIRRDIAALREAEWLE